jgi:hypothetical protein
MIILLEMKLLAFGLRPLVLAAGRRSVKGRERGNNSDRNFKGNLQHQNTSAETSTRE